MIGKRAVCESVFPDGAVFIGQVHNPAGIKRAETQVSHDHCHYGSNLDGGIGPQKPDPSQIKHPPLAEGTRSRRERGRSLAEPYPVVIDIKAGGRGLSSYPRRFVGEWKTLLLTQKSPDFNISRHSEK